MYGGQNVVAPQRHDILENFHVKRLWNDRVGMPKSFLVWTWPLILGSSLTLGTKGDSTRAKKDSTNSEKEKYSAFFSVYSAASFLIPNVFKSNVMGIEHKSNGNRTQNERKSNVIDWDWTQ